MIVLVLKTPTAKTVAMLRRFRGLETHNDQISLLIRYVWWAAH